MFMLAVDDRKKEHKAAKECFGFGEYVFLKMFRVFWNVYSFCWNISVFLELEFLPLALTPSAAQPGPKRGLTQQINLEEGRRRKNARARVRP